MAVAQMCKAAAIAAAADANPAPVVAYFEVKLNRAVSFYGHHYKPGHRHVVDAATLELLGDAVAEKTEYKG